MVNINHQDFNDYGTFCGGTLISDFHILTSAECTFGVDKDFTRIFTGLHRLILSTNNNAVYRRAVAKQVTHPDYNPATKVNDIAVITTDSAVSRNDHVAPICLPTPDFCLSAGTPVTVQGWGSKTSDGVTSHEEYHHMTSIDIADAATCAASDSAYSTDTETCAFTADKGTCVGDIGNSITYEETKFGLQTFTLYGIASRLTVPCGTEPTVYTRVTEYLDWIHAETGVFSTETRTPTGSCSDSATTGLRGD